MKLLRSCLYVPGIRERMLTKAPTLGADALLLDLEDSVPPAEKDRARELVSKMAGDIALQCSSSVFVRVNSVQTKYFINDINKLDYSGLAGISVPKLESPEQMCIYNNEVFVADYSNSQYFSTIKKFDNNGNFILKWGKKGDGDGEFLEINSLTVSSFGEIVVLGEKRIQFFTNLGSFIKIIDPFYDNENYLLRDITIINSDICVSMSNGEIKLLKSGDLFEGIFQTSNQYISQITGKNKDIYISFFDNYKVKVFKMK